MAKYRNLTFEELDLFKKEFVDYLVVNGIAADDWSTIKTDSPKKAAQIIDLFSDVVFEQILRNVSVLEKHDPAVLQHITCTENEMLLIAIKRKETNLDLTATALSQIELDQVEIIKGSKPYQGNREAELFEMISSGYIPTKGEAWKAIIEQISNI